MDEKKINQYKIYNSPRHIITDHMGNTFSSKKGTVRGLWN